MFNSGSRRMAEHWGYFLLFQGTPVHSHYPHQVVHKPLELQLQMIQHPLFFWPPFKLPHVSHTFTDSCVKLKTISKLNHLHFLSWEFMCPPPSFLFSSCSFPSICICKACALPLRYTHWFRCTCICTWVLIFYISDLVVIQLMLQI